MFRAAKVIKNNDENQLGKIQVRIYPELIDVDEDFLPWVDFYSNSLNGTSKDSGEHIFPEVGSWVRVFVEDYPVFHRIKIISNDYVEGLYIYKKAKGLAEITELDAQTYPQPIFKFYKDGTIQFHNTDTGESGTLYGDGSYQIKDKNGNFFSYSKKEHKFYNNNGYIKLTEDGYVDLNGDKRTLVTHEELKTALDNYANLIKSEMNIIVGGATTAIESSGLWSTPLATFIGNASFDISNAEAKKVRTVAPTITPSP